MIQFSTIAKFLNCLVYVYGGVIENLEPIPNDGSKFSFVYFHQKVNYINPSLTLKEKGLQPVWPDDGIKSSTISSKVAKYVGTIVFTLKVMIFKMPKEFSKYLGYFCNKNIAKNYKNRPIWSRCLKPANRDGTISRIFILPNCNWVI